MEATAHKFSGARLRAVRHQKGWTQAEFARRAGVRERQIIRWENDQNDPRLEAVARLAEVAGERIDVFFDSGAAEVAADSNPFRGSAGEPTKGRQVRSRADRKQGGLAA